MGKRKVNNKSSMRGRVFKYLKDNPQELDYIVGDYVSRHGYKLVKIK